MPSRPEISVIVPVYNVADHVAACIASLRAQTFTDFEAIVVDDGATDDSHALAVQAIGDDTRFRVIRQENRGLSAARNTGLEAARGRFIAFVDSDDRADPRYLEDLLEAIRMTGAPMAACAVRSVYPGGAHSDHSAIHSAPEPNEAETCLMPLETWAQVIDHFPSAWNKLYAASLIAGLRFEEGTLFEDHAFFQAAAKRADVIAHVGSPLYLQTRERPGQITGADNDGVFDQISVLDALADGMDARKPGGAHAYATLTSRLLYERAGVIRDPVRRAAFIRAANDLLSRRKLRYLPDWPTGIGASFGSELAGQPPLSIVIPWDGQEGPLRLTLAALAQAEPCGAEVLIVCDRCPVQDAHAVASRFAPLQAVAIAAQTPGAGGARNTGLKAARGTLVMFLDAGDMPALWLPLRWSNEMLHQSAQVGFAPHRIGMGEDAGLHDGFHDPRGVPPLPITPELIDMPPERVLKVYPHPSAFVFSTQFLRREELLFGDGHLECWPVIFGALQRAERVLRFDWPALAINQAPDCRKLWRRPASAQQLMLAARQIDLTDFPPGALHRLYARALWEKANHTLEGWSDRTRFWLGAAKAVSRLPPFPDGTALDPYLGPRLERLIRASGQSRLRCIARALGR